MQMYSNLLLFLLRYAKMQCCGFKYLMATIGCTVRYICIYSLLLCLRNNQIKYKNCFLPATTNGTMQIVQHSTTCACMHLYNFMSGQRGLLAGLLTFCCYYLLFVFIFLVCWISFQHCQFYCCNCIPQNSAKLTTTINIIVKFSGKVWVKTQKCRSNNNNYKIVVWKNRARM